MVAPKIALRFRETTPGVDTITAHTDIIRGARGAVWWGWWKKLTEDIDLNDVRTALDQKGGADVYLIDADTDRAFVGHCVDFGLPAKVEREAIYVPEYYRNRMSRVAAFLLFDSIRPLEEDESYPQAIADAFGESTFLWTDRLGNPDDKHVAKAKKAEGRSHILHLSDLHFGRDYAFQPQGALAEFNGPKTLTECLVNDLTNLGCLKDIAAVIVTGDFMTGGDWSAKHVNEALAEFESLRKALGLDPEQIIAVPGNHDIIRFPKSDKRGDEGVETVSADDKNPASPSLNMAITSPDPKVLADEAVTAQVDMKHEEPFRQFVESLTGRHSQASLNYVRRIELNEIDLLVCALNSCVISGKTNWTQYGFVGKGSAAIRQLRREEIRKPTYKFLALHHHLLPVADIEYPSSAGVSMTLDASDVLLEAQRAQAHIVLHGHQHKPKITHYRAVPLKRETKPQDEGIKGLYVIANGSASVKSLDNRRIPHGYVNTFCLLKLTKEAIELTVREIRQDGGRGETQFQEILEGTPIQAAKEAPAVKLTAP